MTLYKCSSTRGLYKTETYVVWITTCSNERNTALNHGSVVCSSLFAVIFILVSVCLFHSSSVILLSSTSLSLSPPPSATLLNLSSQNNQYSISTLTMPSGQGYTYNGSGTNSQASLTQSPMSPLTSAGQPLLLPRLRLRRFQLELLPLLQQVGWSSSAADDANICRDGSFYYSNPNGSTYYNNGKGGSSYSRN